MAEKDNLVNNKKKAALERTKNKISSLKAEINTNPQSIDGSMPTSVDSYSPTGGVDNFTRGLTEAWQCTRATEFSDWIIDDVKNIRSQWDEVAGKIDAEIERTPKEDQVPKGTNAADPKWDRVP